MHAFENQVLYRILIQKKKGTLFDPLCLNFFKNLSVAKFNRVPIYTINIKMLQVANINYFLY